VDIGASANLEVVISSAT